MLVTRVRRLHAFTGWLAEDPELVRLIDTAISNHTRVMARRQAVFSAMIAAVSLVVGWVLPGLLPIPSLAHLLHS